MSSSVKSKFELIPFPIFLHPFGCYGPMMAETNFTLLINLSNFFKDHRQIARIYIGDKINTIQDIQNKVTKVFGIENFFLLSHNEYLPPSEDIRILRRDDIIWAIPAKSCNLNYENVEVDNIEYSPTKLKKTKRKYNSGVNGTDEDVSKKRKHRLCSVDSQEDKAKSEEAEKTEKHTKSTKKKKKKRVYEEIQPEDEYIPKISKKNKCEEVEQTCTNKIQKQIENSKKKNVCESNKLNYLEKSIDENQVTVGNALPENVSFKKCTQIPTITDEYLKEKKINIVKIDYISKPSAASQIEAPSADQMEIGPIQNVTEVTKNSEVNESKSSFIKTNSGVEKTTKFFFLNTPSRQKIEKPVKQKRSNIFKLNISPSISPFVTKIKKIETNQEVKLAEEKINNSEEKISNTEEKINDMFKLGLNPVVTNNENIEISCEKQQEEEVTEPRTDVFTLNMIPDVIKNKAILTNGHSNEVSPSIYIHDIHIIPGPTKENIETNNKSGIIDSSMKTEENFSALNKNSDFEPISQTSTCVTTILDTPDNDFGISGIEFIKHSKYSARKQISGVGQLLDSIRKGESSSGIFDASSNSLITENVTKRKRTRRTRSKKKKNTSFVAEKTLSPINSSISDTPRPMVTDANPKLHIKFSDDEENIEHSKNTMEDVSCISIGSDNGELHLLEENILKAPLMSKDGPKIGNIISFKILRISHDFTPEVSSYIIGRVIDFSEKSQLVELEITFGVEQFERPNGKFSLVDNEKSFSVFRKCLWPDLIEPRLIDP